MALHEFVWECLEFHMHIIESVTSAKHADENMKYLCVDILSKHSNVLCNNVNQYTIIVSYGMAQFL